MRIMIFGRPGSGKSTFSVMLSHQLNITVHHLDKIFFESDWQERDYDEFMALQRDWVNEEKWIIDGNSTKSLELRYQHADLCLYFNFPRWHCYWRVFKRLFIKNKQIDDRAPNCPETVRWSLLKYMWSYEKRVEKIIERLNLTYPNVEFLEIRNDQAAMDILTKLEAK